MSKYYSHMFYYLHDTIKQYKVCMSCLHMTDTTNDIIDYIDINIYKIRIDQDLNYKSTDFYSS